MGFVASEQPPANNQPKCCAEKGRHSEAKKAVGEDVGNNGNYHPGDELFGGNDADTGLFAKNLVY